MPNSTNTIGGIAAHVSRNSCVTSLDDMQLSDGLLSGAVKNAAVVACSDMGASVPFVCTDPSAHRFLFQNGGHRFDTGGMIETIAESGIEHVVVYGHSECDSMTFLVKSGESLRFEDEGHRRLSATAVESDSEADWKSVGQYTVLNELNTMLANPVIAPRAANGRRKMHGWFYHAATRQIEVFEPQQQAFMAVTH